MQKEKNVSVVMIIFTQMKMEIAQESLINIVIEVTQNNVHIVIVAIL